MNENVSSNAEKKDGKSVLARIDAHCGYCKREVKSNFKVCPYCEATLVLDTEYDALGRAGREYYLSKI